MSISTPMLRLTPASRTIDTTAFNHLDTSQKQTWFPDTPSSNPSFDDNDFQSNANNGFSVLSLPGLGLLLNNEIPAESSRSINSVGLNELRGLGLGGDAAHDVYGTQGTGLNIILPSLDSKIGVDPGLEADAMPDDIDSRQPSPPAHGSYRSHKPPPVSSHVNANCLDEFAWLRSPPTLDYEWLLQYPYGSMVSLARGISSDTPNTELVTEQPAPNTSNWLIWSGPEDFSIKGDRSHNQFLDSQTYPDHELLEIRGSPGIAGPIADINMYTLDPFRDSWSATINPMNLTGDGTGDICDSLSTLPPFSVTNFLPAPNSLLETPRPKIEISDTFTPFLTCGLILEANQVEHLKNESTKSNGIDDQTLPMPGPAVTRSGRPSQKKRKRRLSLGNTQSPHLTAASTAKVRSKKPCQSPDVDLGTPVIDAHRGIEIDDLRAKAERYILRNKNGDFCKRWLVLFVGRLTAEGERLNDFRCYVGGCGHTNKRKDHILIHMGAHLDLRPFICSKCPSRFFRKNECKRHEAGHLGKRPFACMTCPKAFSRQDLLQRHTKNIHHIARLDKENEHQPGARYSIKRSKQI